MHANTDTYPRRAARPAAGSRRAPGAPRWRQGTAGWRQAAPASRAQPAACADLCVIRCVRAWLLKAGAHACVHVLLQLCVFSSSHSLSHSRQVLTSMGMAAAALSAAWPRARRSRMALKSGEGAKSASSSGTCNVGFVCMCLGPYTRGSSLVFATASREREHSDSVLKTWCAHLKARTRNCLKAPTTPTHHEVVV